MRLRVHMALLALPGLAIAAQKADPPSALSIVTDSAAAAVVRVVDFVAHPVLQVATWPLQNVLAPVVEAATYPVQPPLRYFLEEDVIDRAADLFRYGKEGNLSAYPTLSLAAGTASRMGATLRHAAPFGREDERLVAYFLYYVNGDYRFRSFVTAKEFLGGPDAKFAFALGRFENAVFYQPDVNLPYSHSWRSENYESQLDWPLMAGFYFRTGLSFSYNRFGEGLPSLVGPNVLEGDFFRDETGYLDPTGAHRGFGESLLDRAWLLGLVRDTRNNENIPVDGSRLEAAWLYHDVNRDHDYHEWWGRYAVFFKLGRQRYEITAEEERRRGSMSLNRWLQGIEYQRIRERLFLRKVLALQLYAGQSYEIDGNSMPMYGLKALGSGTPLRAYSGSRYRHYAVAAASAEYRFPILRLMDGTIFNEYGIVGRSLGDLEPAEALRNSWGFGVRVRRPDMFLFRAELAFHGISGAVINVNADTPF